MAHIPAGHLPLRVNQLDASDSDDYINEIILDKLKEILKYLKASTLLTTYQHELEAAVKLALWLLVFRKHHATLGQQMLQLRYTPSSLTTGHLATISNLQSLLYLLSTVVIPYINSRLSEWLSYRQTSANYPLMNKVHTTLTAIWCGVSLTNFIIFLRKGAFLHVYERLCGIRTVHPGGRQLREVGFEFSNREIVWHGFAEFMIFLVPYINVRKLKKVFSKDKVSGAESRYCMICNNQPVNPQQMQGCTHLYCYHCIATSISSDGALECSHCAVKIASIDFLQPAVHRLDPST